MEIPEDLQQKHDWQPLGPVTGEVKRAIFGLTAAKVYGVDVEAKRNPMPSDYKDKLAQLKAEYQAQGAQPSHAYYGWIQRSA